MLDDGITADKAVVEGESIAQMSFFMLGVGNMFPWNAFITAAAYYRGQFCGAPYESSFLSYFSTMFTVAQPLALFVNVYYHNFFSIKTLVRVPLVIYNIVFAIATLMVIFPSISADAMFATTLISLFVVGFVGSMMNGGLYALAGILPSGHTSAIMSGQAMAGFLVALVQLIATASTAADCDDGDDDDSSCDTEGNINYGNLAYFLVACSVLCLCIILFYILWNLPFIVHYRKTKLKRVHADIDEDVTNVMHASVGEKVVVGFESERTDSIDIRRSKSGVGFDINQVLAVAKMIKIPAYSVFIAKCATLMAFPAVMAQITPVGSCHTSRFLGDLWLPSLFLFNNAGDLLGRLIAGKVFHSQVLNVRNIHYWATIRLILPILFLFCHIDNNHLANVFNSDVIPPLLVLTLGVTNGFVANVAMMMGPTLVPPHEQPLAGTIMGFALVTGLLVGAMLSFFMVYLVTGA